MPLVVVWPRAGGFGARAILPPCTQLLWCELYAMKDEKSNLGLCALLLWCELYDIKDKNKTHLKPAACQLLSEGAFVLALPQYTFSPT